MKGSFCWWCKRAERKRKDRKAARPPTKALLSVVARERVVDSVCGRILTKKNYRLGRHARSGREGAAEGLPRRAESRDAARRRRRCRLRRRAEMSAFGPVVALRRGAPANTARVFWPVFFNDGLQTRYPAERERERTGLLFVVVRIVKSGNTWWSQRGRRCLMAWRAPVSFYLDEKHNLPTPAVCKK